MDLNLELKKIKQQFEKNEFDKNEYNKHRKVILKKWSSESKKIKQPKCSQIDLYAVLQLTPSATETEIKSKFKRLALRYHPDKNGGVETEEWNNFLKAYQILSEKDSRFLYDNYGTVNDTLGGKALLTHHVGGDSWKPYIGNLEIGTWMLSFINDESMPELEHVTSAEQKERRHIIRVSNIARYLQDKLSRFPSEKVSNYSELESFEQSLRQEAQKLLAEPNGKELLSLLGAIYLSKSKSSGEKLDMLDDKSYLNNPSKEAILNMFSKLCSGIWFAVDLVYGFVYGFLMCGPYDEAKIKKLVWNLSRTEISSIACETCEKVLNNSEYNVDERYRLTNSLGLLGKVWTEEASKEERQVDAQNANLNEFLCRRKKN